MAAPINSADYRTETGWQHYQPFFPAHARIDARSAPAEEWFAWRGASIHVDRWRHDDAPLTVILVHGGGGYGRMFAPIGKLLHEAGHAVLAPDLPGYGLSQAPHSLVNYTAWVDLLCALVTREHERKERPVVLCGGSLGGYLAYLCAARMAPGMVAGLIATTLADPRTPLVKRQFTRNWLLYAMLPAMPWVSPLLGRLRLPVKWFTRMHAMSNNAALSELVAADPLGGGRRVPLDFMQSIFAVQPDVEPEDFSRCPVLLAHPGDDRWTTLASSQQFFERIKGPKKQVLLENCGHFPVEQPGFTMLEHAAVTFLEEIATAHQGGSRRASTIT